MFISYCVCLKCRGWVVTNVVRICDPTPLLYIFGNKICLNYKKAENKSLCYSGLFCIEYFITLASHG